MSSQPIDHDRRRGFLRQVAGVTALAPFVPALATGAAASRPSADTASAVPCTAPTTSSGYLCFSQDEAAFVEAMVNIMCPADGFTASGVECGLPTYIDRQLAGDFGRGAKRYSRGPWQQGKPQLGNQLPLTPEQHFKAGVESANNACVAKYGKPFDQLALPDANAFLLDLGAGKIVDPRLPLAAWFNELVYPLFTQACFSDPIYGGNANKVFWRLIGYPGLPATHSVDMVRFRGKPYPGASDPKSIADFG